MGFAKEEDRYNSFPCMVMNSYELSNRLLFHKRTLASCSRMTGTKAISDDSKHKYLLSRNLCSSRIGRPDAVRSSRRHLG